MAAAVNPGLVTVDNAVRARRSRRVANHETGTEKNHLLLARPETGGADRLLQHEAIVRSLTRVPFRDEPGRVELNKA
jgi:hypothetical protein